MMFRIQENILYLLLILFRFIIVMIVVCTTLLTLADTLILHSVFNMEMNSICYYNVYKRQYCFNILKSNSTKLLHMRSTKPVLSYTNTSTKVKPFSILAYSVDLLHILFFYFSLALYILFCYTLHTFGIYYLLLNTVSMQNIKIPLLSHGISI